MNKVRELLLYRMLLAAGSALAALEGPDAIVFSGRYAQQAAPVAEYLVPRLEQTLDLDPGTLPWQSARLRSQPSWPRPASPPYSGDVRPNRGPACLSGLSGAGD